MRAATKSASITTMRTRLGSEMRMNPQWTYGAGCVHWLLPLGAALPNQAGGPLLGVRTALSARATGSYRQGPKAERRPGLMTMVKCRGAGGRWVGRLRDSHDHPGRSALPPARPAHPAGGRPLHRPGPDLGTVPPTSPVSRSPARVPGGPAAPDVGERPALPGRRARGDPLPARLARRGPRRPMRPPAARLPLPGPAPRDGKPTGGPMPAPGGVLPLRPSEPAGGARGAPG